MAKAIVKRAELIKLAKELGLVQSPGEMTRMLDAAQDTDDPMGFIRGVAAEANGGKPLADDQGQAAADRIEEVLQGEATDPALLVAPLAIIETPNDPADPLEFYLKVPNLADVPCTGHKTQHVPLNLLRSHLASDTLTRLRHKLDDDNARLANGKHVTNASDAIKWLLEQYGRAAGIQV